MLNVQFIMGVDPESMGCRNMEVPYTFKESYVRMPWAIYKLFVLRIRNTCQIFIWVLVNYDSRCGGDLPLQVIRWLIHTTSERMGLVCKCKIIITTQIIDGDT